MIMRIMLDAPHANRSVPITAGDLRAALARAGVRAYCVAARLSMHPTTLSQILNGHRAFDPALARRIVAAIAQEQLTPNGEVGG